MLSDQPAQRVRLPPGVTVAVLQRNALDADALGALLQSHRGLRVVGATSSRESFVDSCDRFEPTVALVDAEFAVQAGDVFTHAKFLSKTGKVQRFLFLDDLPNHARARLAINVSNSGYITRRRTFAELVAAIAELLDGHPPLDGFSADWLRTGRRAKRCLHASSPVLRALTAREVEVFQLLAQGRTIETCAETLRLSINTVENHKSRIMKKLRVKKSVQLTLMAVREGLITP